MNLHGRLLQLPRPAKRVLMVAFDLVALGVAMWGAFALRLGDLFPPIIGTVWWLWVLVPAATVPVFAIVGLYRAVIRYLGPQVMWVVGQGVSVSTLVFAGLVFMARAPGIPRSSILLYWLIAMLLVGGSRLLLRAYLYSLGQRHVSRKKVIIYGAGLAGVQLAGVLRGSLDYEPAAFVDDDPSLQGAVVNELRVHQPEKLPLLIDKHRAAAVLLAMPSIDAVRRRRIIAELEPLHVRVKTLPSLSDIVSGSAQLDELREVSLEDLIDREQVAPNRGLLAACIQGKSVMVTGAGGSIGSELCRQIVRLAPRRLVMIDISEFALYAIERETHALASKLGHDIELVPLLGSVLDGQRIERAMKSFAIDTLYHAAAYKHVPIVEHNMLEGVRNNVHGTWETALAAQRAGIETFVLISTDKAVRPTNVMGASKRMAELLLQALSGENPRPRFCMVRFGNVMDSSGSVIPLFREQIRPGGTVTVTHPDVVRYFMSIPEAAELVIQAGSLGDGGDVFVLDMGEPVRIADLARRLIHLMGFEIRDEQNPDGDVAIEYTGLRPGEKLYEELLIGENCSRTVHPMIRRAQERALPAEQVRASLAALESAYREYDCKKVREILLATVDGYEPTGMVEDWLWERRPENRLRIVDG